MTEMKHWSTSPSTRVVLEFELKFIEISLDARIDDDSLLMNIDNARRKDGGAFGVRDFRLQKIILRTIYVTRRVLGLLEQVTT